MSDAWCVGKQDTKKKRRAAHLGQKRQRVVVQVLEEDRGVLDNTGEQVDALRVLRLVSQQILHAHAHTCTL